MTSRARLRSRAAPTDARPDLTTHQRIVEIVESRQLGTAASRYSGASYFTRVLVVDNDDAVRELIADELRWDGYIVDMAEDGQQALRCVREHRPDLVVLDLVMPVMHGWDFIETYQHYTGGEEIPIIVVSAAGAVPRSAERRGVRAFLAKPFDFDDLLTHVAEAVTPSSSAA